MARLKEKGVLLERVRGVEVETFYRHFVFNYPGLTIPLTHLTQKDTLWVFTKACRTSFETLKKSFTTAPVLTHWIPRTPLIIKTNAYPDSVAHLTEWQGTIKGTGD